MLHTFMTSCLHIALVLVISLTAFSQQLTFWPTLYAEYWLQMPSHSLHVSRTTTALQLNLRSADTTVSYLCTRMPVTSWLFSCAIVGFFALTLLVGRQEEHSACRNWVMTCWCGYLSGARCRLLAFGPADAIAIPKPHRLLPHLNLDWFCLSGTGLPRLSWKRGR